MNIKCKFLTIILFISLCFFFTLNTTHALQFNFIPETGTPQEAIDGFKEAGKVWSNLLKDDITVNVDIYYRPLSPGVLGSTLSERISRSYDQFRNALEQNILSNEDRNAWNNLQSGTAFSMLINLIV